MPGGMIFSRSWDFDQGNKPISLNDLRDDDDVLAVLLGLGLGISEADIAADLPDTGTPIGAALDTILTDFQASLPPQTLPAIDHGAVSGTLEADCDAYGLHEIELTGDLAVTPTGGEGSAAALRLDGTGNFSLVGVTWDGAEVVLPGTVMLFRYVSGWRAFAVQFDIAVVPAGVDFTEGSNTITKTNPSEVGVDYSVDDVVLTFNGVDNTGFPEGLVNVVATAQEGYVIATGAQTEWPHTFGPLDAPPLAWDDASLTNLLWYDADEPGALTLDGSSLVTSWNDQGVAALNQDLAPGSSPKTPPPTVTVNGKTMVQFATNNDDLRKTSLPSPANALDATLVAIIRCDNPEGGGVAGLPGTFINALAFSAEGITDPPLHVRSPNVADPNNLKVENIAADGALLFIACTLPSTGDGSLWVGDGGTLLVDTGAVSEAAIAHWFVGGSAARFSVGEMGLFDGNLTQEQVEGLYSTAKAKWGIA